MTASIASPSSKRTETPAATRSDLPWGWPDRVGARLGRRVPALSKAAADRAAENRSVQGAFLALCALLAAGIGLATRQPDPVRPAGTAENSLPADLSSSNLNATSAEAPKDADSGHHLEQRTQYFPTSPPFPLARELVEMEAHQGKPVPPAPLAPIIDEQQPVGSVPSTFSPMHPGETYMIRNWKALGLSTILLAAFSSPALSAPEDVAKDDKTPATAKDIAELKKAINTLSQNLAVFDQNVGKDIDALKKQVESLQKEVDSLKKGPTTTTVLKPAANARLELTNDYPYQIDFVVNEATYQVAPGMTRVLNLPVGSTYTFRIPQLTGYQANQTRSIGADGRQIRVYTLQ